MGVLAGLFTLTTFSPVAIILLWIMTFLPDFDVFLEPLQKIRKMYFFSHKAGSHSYIVGIFFTGIVGFVVSLLSNVSFSEVWFAGFIGYSIHVSLDFFAASKIPIFYPISKKEFRFIADRAVNPLLATFSGINLLVLVIYYYTKPYYHIFMDLAFFYFYAYLTYFGIRALLRVIIQVSLSKNQQYLPGFLPFIYYEYEKSITREDITFKLTKRSAFSLKSKEIFNHSILKNSHSMSYYEMAENLSRKYRFFHKWNSIIPFMREKDNSIHVVLILAESYSHKSSYFLSVVFDKDSKQIKSKEDGFGSFKKWRKKSF